MTLLEKIRETIEMNDSLVQWADGIEEHCILPEHYDMLAQEIVKLLPISGIVRPEGDKKNCDCTGPWDCSCQDVLSEYYKGAQEGEPLPAEGEAQSGGGGCKRTVWCDANPTFGRCSYCGGKF